MATILLKNGFRKIAIIVLAIACGLLTLLYPQWQEFARAQGYLQDDDKDGLPDEWELNGVDTTGNGVPDLFLNTLDEIGENIPPNPNHKDVYVWVDWLKAEDHHHKPDVEALERVKEAFSEAPIAHLNPDRKKGINLHIILGQAITETEELKEIGTTNQFIYFSSEFGNIKKEYLQENGNRKGMASVFHYALYAHYLPEQNIDCPYGRTSRPSGIAPIIQSITFRPGSDFIIGDKTSREAFTSELAQAGLFMHELGHTLNLGHGGVDIFNSTNNKPNHLSVMNYSFTRGILFQEEGAERPLRTRLDYSRFSSSDIPPLNEDQGLVEAGGLRGGAALNNYGTIYDREQNENDIVWTSVPANGLGGYIDWNDNKEADVLSVKANINGDSIDLPLLCLEKYTVLSISNEWEGLTYETGDIGKPAAFVAEYPSQTTVLEPDLPPTIILEIVDPVTVDIKPGSDPNVINLKSRGVIPVAILTTDTFDATTVDPLSAAFGPGGATEAHEKGHLEDIDGDGDTDLVLHFKTQATGIQCDDTIATLTGSTVGGQSIEGYDSINTVGCK